MPPKTAKPKAATAAKRTTTRKRRPTAKQIATRAYFIALERGGDPVDNWLQAEREMVAA